MGFDPNSFKQGMIVKIKDSVPDVDLPSSLVGLRDHAMTLGRDALPGDPAALLVEARGILSDGGASVKQIFSVVKRSQLFRPPGTESLQEQIDDIVDRLTSLGG